MEEEEDDDEPLQIPSVLKALVFACMAGAVTWMIVTDNIITQLIDIVKQHQWWRFTTHLIATIILSMAALILLVISIFSCANMFQQYCNRKTTYVSTDR
ncbi:hypothetical protein RHMOL_Rhmol12G0250800 [Rhododendron molle]|uniref:Uncharacterized protein n=1 Tax=Rhododendron molle TaxID=49168 RepID=A0ACC0LLZ0_RHOML|nr:hypothetical protein RHMOL_Rhmol12G0250800 [Rhododendron molle]